MKIGLLNPFFLFNSYSFEHRHLPLFTILSDFVVFVFSIFLLFFHIVFLMCIVTLIFFQSMLFMSYGAIPPIVPVSVGSLTFLCHKLFFFLSFNVTPNIVRSFTLFAFSISFALGPCLVRELGVCTGQKHQLLIYFEIESLVH